MITAGLIERLHSGADRSPDVTSHMRKYQELCDEAADAIERLQARVVELEHGISIYGGTIDDAVKRAEAAEAKLWELCARAFLISLPAGKTTTEENGNDS